MKLPAFGIEEVIVFTLHALCAIVTATLVAVMMGLITIGA